MSAPDSGRGWGLLRPSDFALASGGAILTLASTATRALGGSEAAADGLMSSAWLVLSLFVVRLSSFLAVDMGFARRGRKRPSELLRLMVSFLLYGAAIITWVRFGLGRDVGSLLAGSAVIGAVGGFALQATLDNLFSGLSLQVEQPFALGDVVVVGEHEGRVESMTWRSVQLRTEGGSLVVIPNSVIGSSPVEVIATTVASERCVEVEASPLAPPGHVIALLLRIAGRVENVAARPAPDVFATVLREWLGSRVYEIQYVPRDPLDYERTEGILRRQAWYAMRRWGFGASRRAAEAGSAGIAGERASFELDAAGREAALRAAPALAALPAAAIAALVEAADELLFTDGEPLSEQPDAHGAIYVVASGRLVVQSADLSAESLGAPQTASDANAAAWDPSEIQAVSARLANHLGPVAELLVRRASRRTVDPNRLRHLLASEIDDAAARAAFLHGVPQEGTWEGVAGDVVGLRELALGLRPHFGHAWAATEVSLLRLPLAALRAALREESAALPAVATRLLETLANHPAHGQRPLPSLDEVLERLRAA